MKVGSRVEVTTITGDYNDGWAGKGVVITEFDKDGFVWVKLDRTKTYYRAAKTYYRAARSELELIEE